MFTSEHGNVSTQIRQNYSSIFNPKPTGLNQSSTFSMALPLRQYHLALYIHQKLHPNPTRMLKHLQREAHRIIDRPLGFSMALPLRPSMRSPPDQISRWGSVWLFTLPLRPYHGSSPQAISPAGLHASSMRSPPDQLRR
jgi:hypothetical protein